MALVEATIRKIAWEEETKVKRLFLITTGKGLNYKTKEKWHDRIEVINGSMINLLTNNNFIFWKSCVSILEAQNG